MNARALFVVVAMLSTSALASPAAQQSGDRGVSLLATAAARSASLLEGVTLDATLQPSVAPPLTLLDGMRFALGNPLLPLAQGAALDAGTKPLLALILGLVVGFGIGHLIAGDNNGFILFLIIDIVIVAVGGVLNAFVPGIGFFWSLSGLALLISHIWQGLDAYGKAGGQKIVEWTRENAIEVAAAEDRGIPATMRTFALQF